MRAACERAGSEFVDAPPESIAGVADNLRSGAWPLNGMRHRMATTSGWFLWAGEGLSDAGDFFKPLHVTHLIDQCPEVMPYLGLSPGHRFLIAPSHEDIWFDPQLLEHEV
jgi:hypothetical protein